MAYLCLVVAMLVSLNQPVSEVRPEVLVLLNTIALVPVNFPQVLRLSPTVVLYILLYIRHLQTSL
jgi:hypothetical protein